ncbi:uncharacterized protein LOC129720358 [Wyeomyia smithii]|uniref:uncharacterized protein LOC129720358 n=1 Tax=Wyeomyia smithii TaxID=174621 RepID=UPI00246804DA|nr:uncharacterized protein LOC129720358 [Wyeomyia smithii]
MADGQRINLLTTKRATMITALGRAEAFMVGYSDQRDAPQVPLRLEYINNIWATLNEVQAELEACADTDEGMAVHEIVRADFESRLFSIKASLITKLPPLPVNPAYPQPPHVSTALSGIKLPTISLPEFDGDYQQWLTFHDTFLIHNNADVPPIQKFHYLRAAVKGEAAQLIESIAISSANYELAWRTLEGRYSNDYLLKKRHLQALFDIPLVQKESAAALHGLVDEFERHTKILHQLGEPTDEWSTILEHLLCTRLHNDSLRAWEEHASTVENPNFQCLVDFLQRRIRVLESISVNDHAPGSQTTPSTNQAANYNRRQSQFRLSSNASTAISSYKCPACNGNHYIARCAKFMQQSVSERKQLVSRKRLCHNCLKGNHLVASCPCELNCRKCNQHHHTLLHLEQSGTIQRSGNDSASRSANPASSTTQSASTSLGNSVEQTSVPATEIVPAVETSTPVQQPAENVLLLTVVVNVIDAYGHAHPARALLDSASQPNLIFNRLVRILRLKRKSVNITVQGAGQMSKMIQEALFATITSRKQNFPCGVEFLIMDKVTADLPAQFVSTAEWNLPTDIFLADPAFNKSQPIDMVIGVKHFYSFFPSSARMQLRENLPLLVDSVFGWVVAGSAGLASSTAQQPSCSVVAVSMITLEESVERFWKTEDLATTDNYSVEERRCESFFTSTFARTHEGRYMVRLPRKPDFAIMLGESEATARRRFELLERRLQRDPDLKAEYHKFMREYLDLGHMKPVKPRSSDDTDCYYLPHHPVFKDSSTTTKVRACLMDRRKPLLASL